MTIMEPKLDIKQNWSTVSKDIGKEVIHSGHFMVSSFEAEAQDDEDEVAVPVPEEVVETETKTIAVISQSQPPAPCSFGVVQHATKFPWYRLSIETSLTKLFQCMSLAYRQKLTSPKWNRFKGIRLRWKDKIRLNNVIWRCWHMQFIKKKNTLVCSFASPLDADTHNKPEAIVLEGKYWKRKLNAVTAEYKKWRLFSHNQILGKPNKDNLDLLAEFDGTDWQISAADNSMLVDEDYMGLMSDTLFSTISANQPFAFPDTREIARGVNLADFIQPSLVQLQPNLDEFMDIEPLHDYLCSRLSTVPEETAVAQPSRTQPSLKPNATLPPISFQPPPPPLKVNSTSTALVPRTPLYPSQSQYSNPSSIWFLPDTYEYSATPAQPPPSQQYTSPITTAPPPVPPPPPPPAPFTRTNRTRKDDLVTQTKLKKTRSRSEGSKKLGTSTNTVISQPPNAVSIIQSTSTQLQSRNALLAQLLTNTSGSSYGFFPEEQTCSPTKVLSGNEDVSYTQAYNPIDNAILYHSESDLNKQSFLINSEANSNSSTASHSSSILSPNNSTLVMKPLQTSIGGTIPGPSSSCPESPVGQESLSLSPLNVGSPTSSTGKPAYREHRRVCHINAEQKRRCNIKSGFDTLHFLIPVLSQNPSIKLSKAAILQKGAEYILQLQNERHQRKQEIDSLKQEIESLNSEICNSQLMLPATGAPISKHRSNIIRDMYRTYVRARVHENWKFWILSLICESLLETFINTVSTASMDELYRTTLQWVDQHCSLVDLRPIVLYALRHLSTTTDVLTDPARLPIEAKSAVNKDAKKK